MYELPYDVTSHVVVVVAKNVSLGGNLNKARKSASCFGGLLMSFPRGNIPISTGCETPHPSIFRRCPHLRLLRRMGTRARTGRDCSSTRPFASRPDFRFLLGTRSHKEILVVDDSSTTVLGTWTRPVRRNSHVVVVGRIQNVPFHP